MLRDRDIINPLVVLPVEHRVKDVTYRNNENVGNTTIDRKAIFDISMLTGFDLKYSTFWVNISTKSASSETFAGV